MMPITAVSAPGVIGSPAVVPPEATNPGSLASPSMVPRPIEPSLGTATPYADFDAPAAPGKPCTLDTKGVISHRPRNGHEAREIDLKSSPERKKVSLTARQLDLIRLGEVQRDQITRRLRAAGQQRLADVLDGCHRENFHRVCHQCRHTESWWNHCDNRICPICQPRLSTHRKREIEFWTSRVSSPLHVVLTVMNTGRLSASYVAGIRKAFARLRRTRFAQGWKSGLWAIETTNKGRGWHVHIHALVEARWIDAAKLAIQWGRQVGQEFAICKVQRVQGTDYLREVCKYAVKGCELEHWTPDQLSDYVESTSGQRLFGVFGRLYGARKEWTKFCRSLKDEHAACTECGCTRWAFFDEDEWEVHLAEEAAKPPPLVHVRTIPREPEPSQLEFARV